MNRKLDEAHLAVENARDALREGRHTDARQWAEQAAKLAPHLEDPWLILAAIASPRDSLAYIQHALKINPESPRAHRGMEWAMRRLREPEAARSRSAAGSSASQPPGGAEEGSFAYPGIFDRRRTLRVCGSRVISRHVTCAGIHYQAGRAHTPGILGASLDPQTYIYPGLSACIRSRANTRVRSNSHAARRRQQRSRITEG
jgi:hypothetical protein